MPFHMGWPYVGDTQNIIFPCHFSSNARFVYKPKFIPTPKKAGSCPCNHNSLDYIVLPWDPSQALDLDESQA